jgi:integrase
MAKLTARTVQAQRLPGVFSDGNGLYLQVAPGGSRSWIYRYQRDRRRREMGLGSVDAIGLAEARELAAAARRVLTAGGDPIEARRAERARAEVAVAKVVTFQEAAERYVTAHKAGWRNPKHAAQWGATLAAYAYPVFGDLPVADIDTGLVLKAIEPIWATKSETATRVRGRVESILDWARVRGYRCEGENPARWRGHLNHILPAKSAVAKVVHHASLPYAELPGFWPRLQVQDGLGARALELCVLTATRTSELLGARWDEIDIDTATWTIPALRMKAAAQHRVPLSDAALALLHKLAAIRMGELIFPGQSPGRPLSAMTMVMTLRRMMVPATPHGFRSTFRTWTAEQTAFPHEVAEAYQRGDLFEKRRQLMAAWATYCTTPRGVGRVVPIRA